MPDDMTIEILEDGTISVKTTEISEKNHLSADQLLDELENMLGGERKTEQIEHEFWKNRVVARGGKIQKVKTK